MCYFDTFICCNMIAVVVIFITSYNYSMTLLSIFIILCIKFLWLIYYLLQICILKYHQCYTPPPHNYHFTLCFLQV